MSLRLITPRTSDPVTLTEAKAHLRVDGTDEDTLITALITEAADEAEHITGRALLPQTWLLTMDRFGTGLGLPFWGWIGSTNRILIPRAPVTSITSVQYKQYSDGALTTLSSSAWELDNAGEGPARLSPIYATSWPPTREMPEAVQVTFVAGYADAAHVPAGIKSWMKLRIGDLWKQREAWTEGSALQRNEFTDCLLDRWRTWAGPEQTVNPYTFGRLG